MSKKVPLLLQLLLRDDSMSNALFICNVCWKVHENTCPTCPDRGNGRGVTVQRIKDVLNEAPDHASINATIAHYQKSINALNRSRQGRVMAMQIENLADHLRSGMKR